MTFPTDTDTLNALEATVKGETDYSLDILLYFLSAHDASALDQITEVEWTKHPLYTYDESVIYRREHVIAALIEKIKESL